MKSWTEDFVDEDTGEVVSIERNEVVVERETIITEDNVDQMVKIIYQEHVDNPLFPITMPMERGK